jgi:hypothetical protein
MLGTYDEIIITRSTGRIDELWYGVEVLGQLSLELLATWRIGEVRGRLFTNRSLVD